MLWGDESTGAVLYKYNTTVPSKSNQIKLKILSSKPLISDEKLRQLYHKIIGQWLNKPLNKKQALKK